MPVLFSATPVSASLVVPSTKLTGLPQPWPLVPAFVEMVESTPYVAWGGSMVGASRLGFGLGFGLGCVRSVGFVWKVT